MPAQAFEPFQLGPILLENRLVRTAAFEGMTPGGRPSAQLVEHHRQMAAGGVALTTVAYCAVHPDGRTFADQLVLDEETASGLRRLTEAVHEAGGRCCLQLGHAGLFADRKVIGGVPKGPSRVFNIYGLSLSSPMTEGEIQETIQDFAQAARLARRAGFDAVEIHLGHGYLLSQFLSPATNRRTDAWGGDLDRRLKLPLAVVRAVLEEVGGDTAVLAKINMTDGFAGGLEAEEALVAAKKLEDLGVTGLVLSGGFVSRTPFYMLRGRLPVREMAVQQPGLLQKAGLALFGRLFVQEYPYRDLFFLDLARRFRQVLRLPLVYVGGVTSRQAIETVLQEGFELVALGRALIAQPDFPARLRSGDLEAVDCDHCNRCVAAMTDGGTRCVTRQEGCQN